MAKQRKPQSEAVKPTQEEWDRRVDLTHRLLSKGLRKSDIITGVVTDCAKRGYDISRLTVRNNYLVSARKRILKEINEERLDQQASSLAFYKSVLSDLKASNRDKIKAQERIDKLLGLEAPQKVAQTDSEGRDKFDWGSYLSGPNGETGDVIEAQIVAAERKAIEHKGIEASGNGDTNGEAGNS